MNFTLMSDTAVLDNLGQRVQRERLNRNITQAALAMKAGVSRRALQNLESGKTSTTLLLVRVLRALDMLDALNSFLPEPGLSPLQLARLRGHERQRAAGRRTREGSGGQ